MGRALVIECTVWCRAARSLRWNSFCLARLESAVCRLLSLNQVQVLWYVPPRGCRSSPFPWRGGGGVSAFVGGRVREHSPSAPCPSVQLRYLHVSRRTGGVPAGVGRPRSGASVFLPPLFAGAVGRGVATCIPSRSLFFSITRRARRCPGFAAGVAALCSVTPSFRFARISCRVGSAGSGVRVAHAYRGPFSLVLGRPLPIAASCPPSF